MAVRKRKVEADYIKVNGKYEVTKSTFTAIDQKPGAKTTKKRYIGDSSASSSITGYEPTADFEADQIINDKVIDFMVDIGKMRRTGADSETQLCQVELDRPGTTEGTYYARESNVSVQVDEFPDNDGERGIKGSFNYIGDPVEGTFNVTTREFTAGFNPKTLECAYTATGTVTDIDVSGVTYDSTEHKFKNIPANVVSFTFKDGETTKTATIDTTWNIE